MGPAGLETIDLREVRAPARPGPFGSDNVYYVALEPAQPMEDAQLSRMCIIIGQGALNPGIGR
ncbi:MAG: hypothetical protein GY820_39515 [Gammaproteobacteria bacterium]|nr:hypothetical protein [Gammaproteobacteria bacterium]